MPERLKLKLLSSTQINSNTVHFEFKILNDAKLELIAGQFLRLLFEQAGEEVFRSYSIANILADNTDAITHIELAVAWVEGGLATVGLQNLSVGDTVDALAPYGRFCLTDESFSRYFMIATGTGITPYRAMTHELFKRINNGAEVFIIMGARDESGLLYAQEFRQNATIQGYHYITCLSREKMHTPTVLDFNGHVQTYIQQLTFDAEHDIAYLCGNPAMVDETFELLKQKGLPVAQIRREKYVSPPKKTPKPAFNVK